MIEGGSPEHAAASRRHARTRCRSAPRSSWTAIRRAITRCKRANGRNVTYPDGRKLFLGSSGTGAPTDGADPTEKKK